MLDDDIKCVRDYVNEGFGLTTPVMESFGRIITELKAQERADNSAMDAIAEFDKVVRCLALELPGPVWDDVNAKWQKIRQQHQ